MIFGKDLDEDEQSEYDEYKSWKKMNNSFREEKRREENSTPLETLASPRTYTCLIEA